MFEPPATEADLVARLRARDDAAFEMLVQRYGAEIQAVAFVILRDPHAAEDAAAETLVLAWRKITVLRDPRRLRPWLLRIATRAALRVRRRERDAIPLTPEMLQGRSTGVDDALDHIALIDALDRLPPRIRAALALHYVADMTVDAVAEVMGTTRNTVKTQLRDGLQRMREALDPEASQGGR